MPAMTTEQIKAGLKKYCEHRNDCPGYLYPGMGDCSCGFYEWRDAALSRLGEPSEDVQPVINGLRQASQSLRLNACSGALSPSVQSYLALADLLDAAVALLRRQGAPLGEVEPVIAGLELLQRHLQTELESPARGMWSEDIMADMQRVDAALTLLRQQADADLATRDWREFVANWKAEATSNEVRLLQARVKDLVAQLEALEQRLGVEHKP